MSKSPSSDHRHPVSAETLAAYQEGRLSPTEAHALEMAALDDPLLAEAMEGLEMVDPGTLLTDVAWLNSQIDAKTREETKVIPFWQPARVAAVVALLIAAGLGIYWWMPAPTGQELAMEAPTAVEETPTGSAGSGAATQGAQEDSMPEIPIAQQPPAPTPQVAETKQETPPELSKELPEDPSPTLAQNHATDYLSREADAEPESAEPMFFMDAITIEDVEPEPSPVVAAAPAPRPQPEAAEEDMTVGEEMPTRSFRFRANEERAMAQDVAQADEEVAFEVDLALDSATSDEYAVQYDYNSNTYNSGYISLEKNQSASAFRNITGTVTDAQGDPLPGVTVTVPGLDRGAVSDLDGYFSVVVPFDAPELKFSYVGFATQKVDVMDAASVDVELQPDVRMLSEVVIMSTQPIRVAEAIKQAGINVASPYGGYENYYSYLINNLEVPGYEDGVEYIGDVTINFVVDKFGDPTDFKVSRSVGIDVDRQLIRLIKVGPGWIPASDGVSPVASPVTLAIPIYR